MKFSAFALLGAILASTATADVPKSSIKNVGDVASSVSAVGAAEQPTSKLPFDISVYSQAAGLAQQTYCYTRGKTGQKVGDSTLLFTTGDGIDTQRVNIYDSASLGLVVAYEGTNISSIHSILYDAEFVLVPGDSVLDLPFGSLVDQGFQSAFLKTWPLIKQQVTTLKTTHGKGKLTVVGHSLGASQASLAAFALRKQFGTVDKVVTCEFSQLEDLDTGTKMLLVSTSLPDLMLLLLLPPSLPQLACHARVTWSTPTTSTRSLVLPSSRT